MPLTKFTYLLFLIICACQVTIRLIVLVLGKIRTRSNSVFGSFSHSASSSVKKIDQMSLVSLTVLFIGQECPYVKRTFNNMTFLAERIKESFSSVIFLVMVGTITKGDSPNLIVFTSLSSKNLR